MSPLGWVSHVFSCIPALIIHVKAFVLLIMVNIEIINCIFYVPLFILIFCLSMCRFYTKSVWHFNSTTLAFHRDMCGSEICAFSGTVGTVKVYVLYSKNRCG